MVTESSFHLDKICLILLGFEPKPHASATSRRQVLTRLLLKKCRTASSLLSLSVSLAEGDGFNPWGQYPKVALKYFKLLRFEIFTLNILFSNRYLTMTNKLSSLSGVIELTHS